MNITTATPAEIDTRIAAIAVRQSEIQTGLQRAQYTLDSKYASESELDKAVETIKALNVERGELFDEVAPLNEAYRAQRWTRFYLVTNSNGHVHTSTECETCFADTDFGWLTQFSGTEQDEMGKLSGDAACARCFPNLPAEVMKAKRDARIDTPKRIAEREERDAAKAAREAKKAAKAAKDAAEAITNPDGTPVLDSIGYEIKRDAKVQSEYVEEASSALFFADSTNVFRGSIELDEHKAMCARRAAISAEHAVRYLAALAHKAGVTTEEKAAELDKKVQAKLRATIRGAAAEAARLGFAY
jgi:hypothetical protein